MTELKEIIAYFCKEYPHKRELSKARLTKMVYLADWEFARRFNCQMSNIKWIYNHYGPFVDDVTETALKEKGIFEIDYDTNTFGANKGIINLRDNDYEPVLGAEEKSILDDVISDTSTQYWGDFIKHVYSTYPVVKSERYDSLDLVELAKEEAKL